MTIETIASFLGMAMGFALMIFSLQPTAPKHFTAVGPFLLITGFCRILKLRSPIADKGPTVNDKRRKAKPEKRRRER